MKHLLAMSTFALLFATCTARAAPADEPAAAEAEGSEPRAKHCLDLIRIKNSEIIDSKHMLFRTTGGDLYLNTLPHPCPGLRRNDPYMVRTSLNRLCDLDIITVLSSTGFGFTPQASCGLGMFEPVTEAQVEMVKRELAAQKAKR